MSLSRYFFAQYVYVSVVQYEEKAEIDEFFSSSLANVRRLLT